jgi:type I restriction enzyme S subunit
MIDLIKINEIFDFEKGTLQSSKCTSGKYDFITASSKWKTHKEYAYDKEALIVAVAASGSLGRVHHVNGKFISSDLCFILTPKDREKLPVDLSFYFHVFKLLREDLVRKTATGTSKMAINQTNFGNYKIPYFDIKHQNKYKDKLVKLAKEKDVLIGNIKDQKIILQKLRQAILQDAIAGKLTADWRKKNLNVEPARELLKKIKVEKEKLVAEKKIKKEKPLPEISEEEIPFDLPKGWEWCRMGELGVALRGKSPEYLRNSNAIAINQKCVRWGFVDMQFVKGVNETWFNSLSKEILTKKDDLLINSTGEGTIGRCAIVDESSANLIFDSHVLNFRAIGLVDTKYILFLINGEFGQRQIDDVKGAKSTKQTELGVEKARNILIPLPSFYEQKAIVKKVETLMQKLDKLEVEISQNQKTADMLMQAVLKEAFEK